METKCQWCWKSDRLLHRVVSPVQFPAWNTHTHARTHTYTHVHTHTQSRTHACTHTHTHTHLFSPAVTHSDVLNFTLTLSLHFNTFHLFIVFIISLFISRLYTSQLVSACSAGKRLKRFWRTSGAGGLSLHFFIIMTVLTLISINNKIHSKPSHTLSSNTGDQAGPIRTIRLRPRPQRQSGRRRNRSPPEENFKPVATQTGPLSEPLKDPEQTEQQNYIYDYSWGGWNTKLKHHGSNPWLDFV